MSRKLPSSNRSQTVLPFLIRHCRKFAAIAIHPLSTVVNETNPPLFGQSQSLVWCPYIAQPDGHETPAPPLALQPTALVSEH